MSNGKWFIFLVTIIAAEIMFFGPKLPEVYGDTLQKPDKIEIDNIRWDINTQRFVLSGGIQFGIATAGEHADFAIILQATIHDSQTGYHLYTMIWILNEMTENLENFEVSQPWDRNINHVTGESFEGNVDIEVEGIIINPSSEPVDNLELISFEDIPVIALICSEGRACPEGATCLFGVCVPDNAPIPRPCEDDSDCPSSLSCAFGFCLPF